LKIQFSQFSQFITPTAPYILYWHEASNTMQLGKWGEHITAANYQSKMLCFKFGGVVGMDLNGIGAFTTDVIKFNPMTTPASVTNDWDTVPVYASTDYPKNVSDNTYHTAANVKAGKGDPCKLVGLTIAQIKAGAIDNGKYRLPTNADNQDFIGTTDRKPAGSAYFIYTPNGENAANPAVATFPLGTAQGASLPCAGARNIYGEVYSQGSYGHYWSSTASSGTAAYDIFLYGSNASPSNSGTLLNAFPVRCVPQ
jgi:hypothetical protein